MPHFGLMDPSKMTAPDAALMRAKLHIRAGKRRLRQGKISAGIVTLYDAITYAIDWYLSDDAHLDNLIIGKGERIKNENQAFAILQRSGMLGDNVDAQEMASLLERALENEMPDYDYSGFLKTVESVMTHLGVMPFDESSLPPEDPQTY